MIDIFYGISLVLAVTGSFIAWESRSFYYRLIKRNINEDIAYAVGFAVFTTGLFVAAMGMMGLGL